MRKKAMLVFWICMFGCIFLFANSRMAYSKDKPIELSYSSFWPVQFGMGKTATAWAEEVEKRTNGRVKITMYHGGILTDAANCYEGVVKGISDIGHSVLAYSRGRFPLMEVIDLPGYSYDAVSPSRVADDLYRKFSPKELADTHVLYIYGMLPAYITTAKRPVKTLEDLKGLKIRSAGLATKITEALGGTPVAMPKGDQYEALRKGMVDGAWSAPSDLMGWKAAEVAKYSTVIYEVGFNTAFFVTMNLNKWNSLPPEIQKIFTEVSKEWVEYSGKAWNSLEIEGIQFGKKVGHTFIHLSPEERTRWLKAVKHLEDDYVKAMEGKGLPGKEVLNYREQLIEKYSKMYPALKFE